MAVIAALNFCLPTPTFGSSQSQSPLIVFSLGYELLFPVSLYVSDFDCTEDIVNEAL